MKPTFQLGKGERLRLLQFLKRRQLKDRVISLLEETKVQHDLKRGQIATSKTATYEELTDSIATAIKQDWLAPLKLTQLLDDAELAGRQHVCLFSLETKDIDTISAMLRSPTTLNKDDVQLEEFWTIPFEPYSRIVKDDSAELVVKVITARQYWVETELEAQEDLIRLERRRERERAALIIKLDKSNLRLQFRVPIKERAANVDTAKSVYQFVADLVESQFGDDGLTQLSKLKPLRIGDAFQKIIANRDDFLLHTDHPENKLFKSTMSRKGSPETGKDIRDLDEWVFEAGFARNCIRGIWSDESLGSIDVRMHYESIKVAKSLSRVISRLFFAKPYPDEVVEHAIKRVSEHI